MENIRLFVYVLLCNLFLLDFNVLTANKTSGLDQNARIIATEKTEKCVVSNFTKVCPTSPLKKKYSNNQANTENTMLDHGTTPIKAKNDDCGTTPVKEHGVTPIKGQQLEELHGVTPLSNDNEFPSSPLKSLPSTASLNDLVFNRSNSSVLTAYYEQGKKPLKTLDSNLNLFDHGTTPITPKK